MRQLFSLVILFLVCKIGATQNLIRTILPDRPIVAGESFRIQYVIADGKGVESFIKPDFRSLRLIAGPDVYLGEVSAASHFQQSKNYVFTLVADRPGQYSLPQARAIINGKIETSGDGVFKVISKEEAAKLLAKENAFNSDYYLRPGEDPYQKIKENLFLRLSVDKKKCFTGEPVTATFKLYSRLESRSEIIKNPGFYGFTVYDMINLADNLVTTERVNGKDFDVHTIRKVQLFPLQAGIYSIDPMELRNRVEFSKTMVYRKTEQQIAEGMLGGESSNDQGSDRRIVEYETHTEPVTIVVNELPISNKPNSFSGAVGSFSIKASISKTDELSANEEGFLDVEVSGNGNFLQMNPPTVKWPEKIESFEPVISDRLDRSVTPVKGRRIFRFPFISPDAGNFVIPAIEFSYFNPDTGRYKTINTANQNLIVKAARPKDIFIGKGDDRGAIRSNYWLLALLSVLVVTVSFFFYRSYNKKKNLQAIAPETEGVQKIEPADTFLVNSKIQAENNDPRFFSTLNQALWDFMGKHFNISGSEMNKENLARQMEKKGVDKQLISETRSLIEKCEAGKFTQAGESVDKREIFENVSSLLHRLQSLL